MFLSATEGISEVRKLEESEQAAIRGIYSDLTVEDAEKVKNIEKITNHDVKAIEYYVKDRLKEQPRLVELIEWIHFACIRRHQQHGLRHNAKPRKIRRFNERDENPY